MSAEGVLGLVAGVRDSSIALVGWALGSVIEGLASAIVIWRFTGARTSSAVSERQAQRAVAISFFVLAPYIAVQAIRDLVSGSTAAPGALGIAVTASSVVLMPLLWASKRRLARTLPARVDLRRKIGRNVAEMDVAQVPRSSPVGLPPDGLQIRRRHDRPDRHEIGSAGSNQRHAQFLAIVR